MRHRPLIWLLAGMLLGGAIASPGWSASWSGVDETVIEAVAEKAGRPAWEPFLNTDQGDLLLFVFLLAGAAGGFAAGYWYRILFPPGKKRAPQAGAAEGPKGDPGHDRTGRFNRDV